MIYLFEITPEGERLTVESRQEAIEKLSNLTLTDVEFRGGTIYTNPLHLASDLVDGSYILFVEFDKKEHLITPIKASAELRNWLRYDRRNTSYGAISNFIGRR
ncbi:hypothetical protein IKG13_01690 [Candidatus Saccharibacteria bacterium]|jgi:hypothetical protein|nr:hypothetical protein [Candidatus Saccharibacteria bacterium]MBR3378461.1 hypothetical protein [Candidatus Saccharibacteria bacterium]